MKGHTYLPNCQTNLVIVHRHSFQKWANLSLFYGLFWSFQTNSITFFTTNRCEKCPSSIQCWDSNPQPSEHESAPIPLDQGFRPKPLFVWEEFLSNFSNYLFFQMAVVGTVFNALTIGGSLYACGLTGIYGEDYPGNAKYLGLSFTFQS